MKEKRLIGISTFFLLLPFLWILPLPCQAASSCPVANTIQPPLDPIENYKDESPFLAPVWFEGESLGCNGGTNVSLCQRNPLPTPGVCIPQDQLVDPFPCTFWKLHLGQDLNSDTPGCRNCDCGHDVFAIANGSVFQIGTDSSWGNYVLLEHEAPSGMIVYSFYAHLQSLEELDGCVSKGAKIGAIGSTGFADTCHLHFEIRRQNPESNPPLGHGYTHHYCSNVLSRYTDPKAFIELYSQNASQEPFHATNPDPPNTATIGKLDECVDDRGTRGSADDVKGPCLQWFKPANADDQDIFLDGFHRGRTWLSCWYLNQTLAPGTHTWEVIPKNAFAVTEHPPLWSFTLNPNACIVPQSTEIASKSTCGSPAVTTNLATGITQGSAALNLFVNPNGFSTQVWFEWGSSSNNLNRSTNRESVGSDDSEIPISIPIDGLSCNTTYSFRAAAENSAGVTRGTIRSFTTASCSSGPGTETRELLSNGTFEQGENFWSRNGNFYIGAASRPRTGLFYAFVSTPEWDAGNNLSGDILNVIPDVPSNAESVTLSFWYSISTDEGTSTAKNDKLHVDVINFGIGTERKLTLSNLNSTGGAYSLQSVDISHLAGRSIGIKFLGETNATLPTVFRIDDVSVKAVVPEAGIPPWVVTQAADQVTDFSARLNLSVDPNALDTHVWFEWGMGSSLNQSTSAFSVGNGDTIFDVSDSLFGLVCETTYSFRALAQNAQGTDEGLPRSFTTGTCPGFPPIADTDPADSITASSARLTGEVNPNGLSTQVWFEWGSNNSLGNVTPQQSVPAGNQYVDVDRALTGLACGSVYYFRLTAQNSKGTASGAIHSFTTSSCSGGGSGPLAGTLNADSITKTSASLRGEINPNGQATEAWFAWGVTSAFGATTARQNVGSGTSLQTISHNLSGLQCGSTYYFKVLAENSEGTTSGSTLNFATLPCDPGEALPGDFLAWGERQSCHGNNPAVLLRWSPSKDASSIYTVRRTDGAYIRSVDASAEGFAHLVSEGFQYSQGYDFYIIAENGAGTTPSNPVRVHIVDQECLGASDPTAPPGPFTLWREPGTCHNGNPAVKLHWSASAGAQTYTLEYFGPVGGTNRIIEGLTTTEFLDSENLVPGKQHAYRVTAYNETGSTRAQYVIDFYPVPGLCGEEGLPGEFVLTLGTLFCEDGQPAIPYSFTASSGADKFYDLRVIGERMTRATLRVNTENVGFSNVLDVGLRPDGAHELFMITTSSQNETKMRFSNSLFVSVPLDICGISTLPPEVVTNAASGITSSSAILRSSVLPNGSPTYVHFQFGEALTYGFQTPEVEIGSTTLYFQRPSMQLTGLACEREYHYRVVALNSAGQSVGADMSFVTEACPPPPPVNTPPSITILEPDGIDDYARDRYYIQWTDSDPDDDASISLAYSTASSCSPATLIRDNISEDDTSNFLLWYTSGLAADDYYILATIDDGVNPPVSACSPGPVAVDPNGSFIFADGFESGGVLPWALVRPGLGQGLSVIGGAANSGAYGARLTLSGCSAVQDLLVPDQVVASEQTFTGCDTVTAGNVDITTGATVTFEAGKRIAIGSGFSVASGASFRAIADPAVRGEGFLEDHSPNEEKEYFATFFSNLSQLTIPDTDRFEHFVGYNGNDVPQFSIVIFGDATEVNSTRAYISARRSDGTYWTSQFSGGIGIPPGWWPMEVHWVSASAPGVPDGSLGLCIQNTPSAKDCNSFSHDNPGTIDSVRWGVLNIDGAATGIVDFDDFHSQSAFPTLP